MNSHRLPSLEKPILLFDGYCNLCTGCVQFVLLHERKPLIQFVPLQSDIAKALLKDKYDVLRKIDSLVFIEAGNFYIRSDAALQLNKYMRFPWSLGRALLIIPAFIRNVVYSFIAKYRYRWFGKRESCFLPTPELQSRLFDR